LRSNLRNGSPRPSQTLPMYPLERTKCCTREKCPQCADFVAEVGEEIGGAAAANVGAAWFFRSPQHERRLDALVPTPATQLRRYLALT
jgi:hypothetical protein